MTMYKHVIRDKPEATERQADIAELEAFYHFKLSEHRANQVYIRRQRGCGALQPKRV